MVVGYLPPETGLGFAPPSADGRPMRETPEDRSIGFYSGCSVTFAAFLNWGFDGYREAF